jgi:DNA-binding NtrC family response regulator
LVRRTVAAANIQMNQQRQNSISIRFLNEVLAERGTMLAIKRIEVGNVLLVEDDPNDVKQCELLFNEIGLHLSVARDANSAMEQIKAAKFSLVLLDLKLPGMTGLELLQVLKKEWPDLRVVLLTAELDPHLSAKARHIGYFGVIIKPLRRAIILDVLIQYRMVEIGPI